MCWIIFIGLLIIAIIVTPIIITQVKKANSGTNTSNDTSNDTVNSTLITSFTATDQSQLLFIDDFSST